MAASSESTQQTLSARQQHAQAGHYTGLVVRLDVAGETVSGLVREERIVQGHVEWDILTDSDAEPQTVDWRNVEAMEEIVPECSLCATVGHDVCDLHRGEADE